VEEPSGIPTMDDPTHIQDSLGSVGDDHDHAEGRGLPIVRAVGDIGAGYGLVPPGAVVWFRTLAEVTAAGAGWTRETTLDGLFPIGAGTTFSQTFAEATSYGSAWLHSHEDDHTHGDDHAHTGPSHTHSLSSHSHTVNAHSHLMNNHTHTISHFHNMNNHTHAVAADGTVFLAALGGGPGSTNVSTAGHAHGSATGGPSNNDTSNNTSGADGTGATGSKSAAGYGTVTSAKSVAGYGTTTSNTTWIPPSRAGIFARKL
jgi:hypothetical protein